LKKFRDTQSQKKWISSVEPDYKKVS